MGSSEDGKASSQHIEEKIVVVGGGIGGLACALALHRVGLKSVVLEQSDTLRAAGSCISLWSNALRVLDVLGVGEQFRTLYHNILEYVMFNQRGKRLAGIVLAECDGPK
jgi:2-polyprenyl-6-methoxyphenol hydroxylase-like FAD-dependent oxidoreductase